MFDFFFFTKEISRFIKNCECNCYEITNKQNIPIAFFVSKVYFMLTCVCFFEISNDTFKLTLPVKISPFSLEVRFVLAGGLFALEMQV